MRTQKLDHAVQKTVEQDKTTVRAKPDEQRIERLNYQINSFINQG